MSEREPQEQDGQNQFERPGSSHWATFLWLMFGLLLALWIWRSLGGITEGTQISYTDFLEQVRGDNVERVVVQGEKVTGTLNSPAQKETEGGSTQQYEQFVTYLPSFGTDELMSQLEEKGVVIDTRPANNFSWWPFLLGVGPVILLLVFGYLFFRRMQSQGANIFSIGKSGAEPKDRLDVDTTFEDVAGNQGPKEELQEIIRFLKEPEHFEKVGAEVPKGVLLVGPPGTGKTLMGRAVAGEADVPFFSITGSDFMEMFVGVGASRVRDLFEKAKDAAPSIIFIDELDSIGRRRGAGLGGGHDEREQTLNQLLSELDGFEPHESVIVMAATNRPDILDKALLRPGRFDRQITVDMPMQEARVQILELHAGNKPISEEVDMQRIAQSTTGFSGADLKNLLNEAALLAARRGSEVIEPEDVEQARDKILMGLERKGMVITDEERELLAYHESGHAIVAAQVPTADPIHKVTIIPRGQAMGVTQQLPEEDKYIYRKEYMLDRLAVMMGGRAAEDLIFETSTSGAENDLKQATKMARKMVVNWGMSEGFQNMALGSENGEVFLGDELAKQKEYSDLTAREVDEEVKRILQDAYKRAITLLREEEDALDQLAEKLLEEEDVSGESVLALLGKEVSDGKAESQAFTDGDASSTDGNSVDEDGSPEEPAAAEGTPSKDGDAGPEPEVEAPDTSSDGSADAPTEGSGDGEVTTGEESGSEDDGGESEERG